MGRYDGYLSGEDTAYQVPGAGQQVGRDQCFQLHGSAIYSANPRAIYHLQAPCSTKHQLGVGHTERRENKRKTFFVAMLR